MDGILYNTYRGCSMHINSEQKKKKNAINDDATIDCFNNTNFSQFIFILPSIKLFNLKLIKKYP